MATRDWLGVSELKRGHIVTRMIAEFLGVLFIVLLGCGSTVSGWSESNDAPTIFRISFAFGFAVAAVVEAFGHVSGGHVNPAITAAMFLMGRIPLLPAMLYVGAQLLGGVAGAGILFELTPFDQRGELGQNMINPKLTATQGMGVEWMISFLLVAVVFSLTDPSKNDSGRGSVSLAVGVAVTVGHLFSIKYTGCGLNPARVFGPAVITGVWDDHWAYWVGEVGGAITAAILYIGFFQVDHDGNPLYRLKGAVLGTSSGKQHISDVEITSTTTGSKGIGIGGVDHQNSSAVISLETIKQHRTDS